MKLKKIYLSVKQTEELISFKKLSITSGNLLVDKASQKNKFSILVEEENIARWGQYYIIFFSAIIKFEIPVSEQNLFVNHLLIPKGLLKTVNRKTPNDIVIPEIDLVFDQDGDKETFVKLRRALNKLILFGYVNQSYQKNIERFIENLTRGFTDLQIGLINKLKLKESFPLHTVNQIRSNEYFKFLWWGMFIVNEVFNPIKNKIGEKKSEKYKKWLNSINVDNIQSNKKLFKDFPEPINNEKSILLGYYLSAIAMDSLSENYESQFIELLRLLEIDEKEHFDILFWGLFFSAFFDEQANIVFPNPLIQDDFFQMEKLSFYLLHSLNNKELQSNNRMDTYKFKNIDKNKLVLMYYALLHGRNQNKVNIIDEDDVLKPFCYSKLSRNNRSKIGFINEDINEENRLLFDNSSFLFRGVFSEEPIVFYGNVTFKEKEVLKRAGINLKIRPFDRLIDNNKKVLVGFLSYESLTEGIVKLYQNIVKYTNIQEFIFVWMIDHNSIDLQSTDFAIKKEELKNQIENDFGVPVKIIVKSHSGSSQEVIRNLKLALKKYNLKNIEIIDCHFTNEQAEWLLLSGKDFVIKKRDIDYFKIVTQ